MGEWPRDTKLVVYLCKKRYKGVGAENAVMKYVNDPYPYIVQTVQKTFMFDMYYSKYQKVTGNVPSLISYDMLRLLLIMKKKDYCT